MEKQYYFICGLPRSGSTLLAGILNQNPNAHASMSTTLHSLFCDIQFNKSTDIISPTEEQSFDLYKNSVNGFYGNVNKEIIFDTNRGWPRFIGLLPRLFPYTKLIICLRDIPSILNSFENHFLFKNIVPSYVNPEGCNNPWKRLEDWYQGMIVQPFEYCDYIYYSDELKKHCIFIDYDDLVANTNTVVNNLYSELNLPFYNHDFNNIEHSFDLIDDIVGNHNLHRVHKKIGETPTKWILPKGAVEKYNRPCFWKGEL
jgi:sulfotransferase